MKAFLAKILLYIFVGIIGFTLGYLLGFIF